jgi:hypothetical protein
MTDDPQSEVAWVRVLNRPRLDARRRVRRRLVIFVVFLVLGLTAAKKITES